MSDGPLATMVQESYDEGYQQALKDVEAKLPKTKDTTLGDSEDLGWNAYHDAAEQAVKGMMK